MPLWHHFLGQGPAARYLISINDCMKTQFGNGTRSHRPRGDRMVEGILHGHRFEIMDLNCHVSSTKISVYQICWRNVADCIALSV